MTTIEKIGRNFGEQIQTTLETMRRRGLEFYDHGEHLAEGLHAHLKTLDVWAKDSFKLLKENSSFKQQFVSDIRNQQPLDPEDKKTRNTIQELYFGLGILLMALGAGQLTGLLWSASILSSIFSPLVQFALLLLLPVYAYLKMSKNFKVYDDVERRDWLYGFVFCVNILLGHLFGSRLLATTPTAFFLVPFVFAMLIDIKISPASLYKNRIRLLAVFSLLSFVSTQVLSYITGMHGSITSLVVLLQCILTALHFQLTMGSIERAKQNKEKYGVSESQILYVLALLMIQLPVSLLSSGRA